MYVRSALILEDVLPDGSTLQSGDAAEALTPGVAAKREESPRLIRATQGEQDAKAVSEDHVYISHKNHRSRTRLSTISTMHFVQTSGLHACSMWLRENIGTQYTFQLM